MSHTHTYIVTSSNNDGSVNYTCLECGEEVRGGVAVVMSGSSMVMELILHIRNELWRNVNVVNYRSE